MPRGLYNWTAQQVIKFLKAHGFAHMHTHGSHYYYVGHYGNLLRQVAVPFHAGMVIKPRTLKSIILQSGIPKDKWINNVKG